MKATMTPPIPVPGSVLSTFQSCSYSVVILVLLARHPGIRRRGGAHLRLQRVLHVLDHPAELLASLLEALFRFARRVLGELLHLRARLGPGGRGEQERGDGADGGAEKEGGEGAAGAAFG